MTSLATAAQLQEVASFPNQQITGVGVSVKSGRIFVNFPYWSDDHALSVAEIVNGQPKAFPNEEWNKPASRFAFHLCPERGRRRPGQPLDSRSSRAQAAGDRQRRPETGQS